MLNQKKYTFTIIILFLAVIITALVNISLGSVNIPIKEVTASLLGLEVEKNTWQYIILNYRLPKAITAIITGSGLAISGLLMQTLFRNPLAGPYVLGLSSGASLGVALVFMGASVFGASFSIILLSEWSLVIASSLGSLLVLFAVILASIRLRDTMAILIIGLMFASLTAAIVSVLAYFSPASQLQQYVFWSYGSLGDLSWNEVFILGLFWIVGILISVGSIKNLNSLLLGEQYARSLGTNIKKKQVDDHYSNKSTCRKYYCLCRPYSFRWSCCSTFDSTNYSICKSHYFSSCCNFWWRNTNAYLRYYCTTTRK